MPDRAKPASLDEIVSRNAVTVAAQIQAAAAWAKSEMDLQVEVTRALVDFARRAHLERFEGHHNITLATGRPDSVYGSVIVEYKQPKFLSPNRDAAPNKALIDQLKKRFYDFRREENRNWNSMFGVGTDGSYFIFLRFRDDKWTDQEPLPVDRYSTERFLWALYNLGQKGKPYQPEHLHADFGSESAVAQEGVRALYDEILTTKNPKAQVFFSQWKILFGEVCGYDVDNPSEKLRKLADFYGVKGRIQPAQLLFAVHTYYAVLIKLLAAEIVSFFNPWMTRQVERLLNATTSAKLRRELEELERGGIFHQMGITNFLEGDLFSWYLGVWSEPVEQLIRKTVSKLDQYNPGTFSEDPAQSRDLLKKLYQQLFPKSVRHDLGEYYTPDWLAEHVLNELGYEGDPDKRLLDPACGSGTFLVMAINRIRHWYDANREKCAYDEGDLLKKILSNVVGFDLNPLAVMAARTNYLVAIKDLVRHVDGVEIPVYLCDSVMTPAEYGDLFTGGHGSVAKVPCSAVKPPHLLVPQEIAKSPKDVAGYAHVLETCIRNAYKPDEFLARCRDEGLQISATREHVELYKELVRLDRENKNGVWARIIKNNFAPLFVGRVDYVAGNPPWINWESLPKDYREATLPVWDYYNLRPEKGQLGKMRGGKKDLSMLFVYCGVEAYLKEFGRLGFVITQTIFKTRGAGDGFRHFGFSHDGETITIKPLIVHDMSRMQVFEGATNRTSVFLCERSAQALTFPVPYVVWDGPSRVDQDETLPHVLASTKRRALGAVPVDRQRSNAPWLTAPKSALAGIEKALGKSHYAGHEGVNTGGLNSCYWIRVLRKMPNGDLVIENLHNVGKIKLECVQSVIEADLVYPLIRGRDVTRWQAQPSCYILAPQDPAKEREGIPEAQMRRKYPKTMSYLKQFEKQLSARADRKYYPEGAPFYTMRNVATYSLAPWKVLWPEVGHTVRSGVCGPRRGDIKSTALPDHTIIAVPCEDAAEAFFVSALLNCSAAQAAISGYVVLHPSPHVLEHIAIPKYLPESKLHSRLAELGERCHAFSAKDDTRTVSALEAEIDTAASKLWGLTNDELKAVHEALAERETQWSEAVAGEEEDDPQAG